MIFPSKNFSQLYAYVASNVIYEISASEKKDDECCVAITKEIAPQFAVNGDPYYLTYLLQDGDSFVNNKFEKRIHAKEGETVMPIVDYFNLLCQDALKQSILKRYDMTYAQFIETPSVWGVPSYMLKQTTGVTVSDVAQIDLTEEEYDKLKLEAVREKVMERAENTANYYGYHVTLPISQLTIEKIED